MIATTPHPVVLRSKELAIRSATETLEISRLRPFLINSITPRPVALRERPAEWRRVHGFAAAGLTKRCKKSGLLIMPGCDAIHDLVNAVDPALLAAALNRWLMGNNDLLLPKTLGIDGKDLGGNGTLGAIITLCHHAAGAPLAMATYSGAWI